MRGGQAAFGAPGQVQAQRPIHPHTRVVVPLARADASHGSTSKSPTPMPGDYLLSFSMSSWSRSRPSNAGRYHPHEGNSAPQAW